MHCQLNWKDKKKVQNIVPLDQNLIKQDLILVPLLPTFVGFKVKSSLFDGLPVTTNPSSMVLWWNLLPLRTKGDGAEFEEINKKRILSIQERQKLLIFVWIDGIKGAGGFAQMTLVSWHEICKNASTTLPSILRL